MYKSAVAFQSGSIGHIATHRRPQVGNALRPSIVELLSNTITCRALYPINEGIIQSFQVSA